MLVEYQLRGIDLEASATFPLPESLLDKTFKVNEVLEDLFAATNTYGDIDPLGVWESIEAVMPDRRSHTALSVGDEVDLGEHGRWYCDHVGWRQV